MTMSSSTSSGSGSSSSSMPPPPAPGANNMATCILDPDLLNAETLPFMKDVGLSIFASACSKNRGAFVLQPADGHTYGCLSFPTNILELSGISSNPNIDTIVDANDILKQYSSHNMTAGEAVKVLDFLVENTYRSTPNVDLQPYGCDVSGLVTLECGAGGTPKAKPVRAVTLAGLLSPTALWATNGQPLTLTQAQEFYSDRDFEDMKAMGLTAVQVPVSLEHFTTTEHKSSDWLDLLFATLEQIRRAGLQAIVVLEATVNQPQVSGAVVAAAKFCAGYNNQGKHDVILAMTLPNQDAAVVEAAATAAPELFLWLPAKGGDLDKLKAMAAPASSQITGAALDVGHTATIADIASSSSQEDRAKMFYHENMACILRAPLEYTACYQGVTTFVGTGFDLAIDNCHEQNTGSFHDYGQCERFNETIHSRWWMDHRQSFAKRQLYVYEQGLGWSYSAWKLFGDDGSLDDDTVIDKPNQLLSLRSVVSAGLFPSLFDLGNGYDHHDLKKANETKNWPVPLACLNPPMADFALGDATLAPTPAPPPDCGNGWWNFTTGNCTFWIPPPPVTAPPCPVCPEIPVDMGMNNTSNCGSEAAAAFAPKQELAGAFVAGVILASVVAMVVNRCCNGKRSEYEAIPNGNGNYQGNV